MQHSAIIGRTGLVRDLVPLSAGTFAPRLFAYEAVPAKTSAFLGANVVGGCGGVGRTDEEARLAAIGECVERYACACYREEDLVWASPRDAGPEAVGMDRFAHFTARQLAHPDFPFGRYAPDAPIAWARGRALPSGEPRLVPASLVYIPYRARTPDDLLDLSVSTGQACHSDPTRALLSALYEVVERDAYMITWLRKLPRPRVDHGADLELVALARRHLDGHGLKLHLFDLTLDTGIPVFLCLAEGRTARGPIFGTGAAAHLDPRVAMVKALFEGVHTFLYARDLLRRKPDWKPAPDYTNVREFEDHVRLYCEPEMRAELGFLLDGEDVQVPAPAAPRADAAAELAEVLARLAAVGLEPIVVELAPPELAALGYHVPKVLIPGAVPLTALHVVPAVGSPRLHSVPRALGLADAAAERMNRAPHSFP